MTSSRNTLKTRASSKDEPIRRIVDRIVKRFDPDKIILFGSCARGDAGPDSDVDLLIVTTPEEFEWRKDTVGTIEWPAWREGKLLYAKS